MRSHQWQDRHMKSVLATLAFAVMVTACGSQETSNRDWVETGVLGVVGVDFPATISASDSLTLTLRYSETCVQSDKRINVISRTATELRLAATATYVRRDPPLVCPGVYIEKTLEYIDPGTPARSTPFEVIVNGKSYGTMTIQ